ncbi:hypothetical protein C161_11048 [Paenibacillus sp. FSL R5-192]|nr:hypothetical protein C161_11048 [Paenibacillus sp. FSL R5-192]
MLSIVDYIAKRKKEDGLNEFNYQAKAENTSICVIMCLSISTIILLKVHQMKKHISSLRSLRSTGGS